MLTEVESIDSKEGILCKSEDETLSLLKIKQEPLLPDSTHLHEAYQVIIKAEDEQNMYSTCIDIKEELEKTSDASEDEQMQVICSICGFGARSKHGLGIHKRRAHFDHVPLKGLDCPYCPKKYKSRGALFTHLDTKHLVDNGRGMQYPCPDCNKFYKSRQSLWMHRRYVHPPTDETRVCELCSRRLRHTKAYREHLRKLHPEEVLRREGALDREASLDVAAEKIAQLIHKYRCPVCQRAFACNSTLKKHVRWVHAADDHRVTCKLCAKEFKCDRALRAHVTCAHSTVEARRKCETCGQVYKNKYTLQFHMRHTHGIKIKLSKIKDVNATDEERLGYARRGPAPAPSGRPELDAAAAALTMARALRRRCKPYTHEVQPSPASARLELQEDTSEDSGSEDEHPGAASDVDDQLVSGPQEFQPLDFVSVDIKEELTVQYDN